jgi:hypothetical protein
VDFEPRLRLSNFEFKMDTEYSPDRLIDYSITKHLRIRNGDISNEKWTSE